MEVKQGYKQTEAGVIPEDWDVKPLRELCAQNGLVRGPFGSSLRKEFFIESGIKVYEQKNAIDKSVEIGSYFIDNSKYNELKRFEVFEGDFIVSCSGTIGKIFQIPHGAPKGIINQALLRIKTNDEVVDSRYFILYFDWAEFQERIIDNTQGGAMKNLVGMPIFKNTSIALPRTKTEQTAIASALSDSDVLISNLEKLVAKKRNIKQGAMQQLLTGKKRLPGFTGEWEIKELCEVAEFAHGRGLSKADLSEEGPYRCIHYGQLFTTYKELIREVKSRTNINDSYFYSKENDVLMPTSDVTPRGLATASCIKENGVALGGGILIIRFHIGYDGLYFSYFVSQNRTSILKLVKGSTVFHLYAADLAKLEVCFPERQEQIAISKVLSDMDAEIEELERKLAKYKMIKLGMMQELLTGKKRLT